MAASCGRLRRHRAPAALLLFVVAVLLALVGTSRAEIQIQHDGVNRRSTTAAAAAPPAPPRHPVKREYNDYSYYVLELGQGSTYEEAEKMASLLGTELVEQVGELRDHWLLRAPYSEGLTKRSIDMLPEQEEQQRQQQQQLHQTSSPSRAEEKDHVMDQYYSLLVQVYGQSPDSWADHGAGVEQLLSRLQPRSPMQSIDYRALPRSGVVSLTRQEIKRRVKRQLAPLGSAATPPSTPPGKAGAAGTPSRPNTSFLDNPSISQYIKDIATRFSIIDPLFPKQWHLANDLMQHNSINVTDVWSQGITGKGIKVAIVDDGLDMHSDDLKDNFYAEGSWDYNSHTDLPEPRLSDDQHGTRCAGEIAAVKNDVCGVGVAYGSKVAGIRILSASISDADEASALNFGYQENDIYSCSWGPPDDGRSMEAPSPLIYKSMLNGVQNGRGGKGNVFVFASGNGGAVDDQCNFDGYTNSIFSITISAIDRKGLHPFYSEGCSANMVVTYSSGSGDSIHTTDVGKNKCTGHHGGTSAAAPIAAGIFALVLQTRPELTWRDMQHLCVQTAIQVNPSDPDWQVTHAGRPYNHKYGYGKLDAYSIVELAKTHNLVKPQAWLDVPRTTVDQPLTAEGVKSTITITEEDLRNSNFERLEHITITVNAKHQKRGQMEVILESPNGVKSILARVRRFDNDKGGYKDWTFMSVKHWDENPVGEWSLTMLDRYKNNLNGTFVDWRMTLWGESRDASLATPFKMVNDARIHLPKPPVHTQPSNLTVATTTYVSDGQVYTRTTTFASLASTTKKLNKPTNHLPGDHGVATGESDQPLDALPTETSSLGSSDIPDAPSTSEEAGPTSSPASSAEQQADDEDFTYLGPWSKLAGSQTWLYVSAGTVMICLAGGIAYLLVRRQQRKRGLDGYGFERVAGGDDDGMPMSALERGRLKVGGDGSATRTKALYDAFAMSDSEEEVEGPYDHTDRPRERKVDDQYMSQFLDADDDDDAESSDGGRGEDIDHGSPRHGTPSPVERYRDDDGSGDGEKARDDDTASQRKDVR